MNPERKTSPRIGLSRLLAAIAAPIVAFLLLLGCPPSRPPAAAQADAAFTEAGTKSAQAGTVSAPGAKAGEPAPASGEAAPTSGEAAPTSGEAAPTSGEAAPTSGEAAPTSGEAAPTSGEAAPVSPPPPLPREPRFALVPGTARPGEPVTVAYGDTFDNGRDAEGARSLRATLLDSGGKRLAGAAFFALPREAGEEGTKAAILAVPSTAASGEAVIRVESAEGVIRDLPFTIEDRDFPSETIKLGEENTALRTRPDPQKTAESEQLWAILSRTGAEMYSRGAFVPPVSSTRRTSQYGHRRVYEYVDGTNASSVHAGVDIGVPTGTEVRACAAGRVVLAKYRIVTGNSVVVEHLPGLYSLYYHLNTLAVSEGAVVEAGSVLGQSGSTGLSTGPHLHWEIRVSGENADPDAFLSRPLLDKNDIFNKLVSY